MSAHKHGCLQPKKKTKHRFDSLISLANQLLPHNQSKGLFKLYNDQNCINLITHARATFLYKFYSPRYRNCTIESVHPTSNIFRALTRTNFSQNWSSEQDIMMRIDERERYRETDMVGPSEGPAASAASFSPAVREDWDKWDARTARRPPLPLAGGGGGGGRLAFARLIPFPDFLAQSLTYCCLHHRHARTSAFQQLSRLLKVKTYFPALRYVAV